METKEATNEQHENNKLTKHNKLVSVNNWKFVVKWVVSGRGRLSLVQNDRPGCQEGAWTEPEPDEPEPIEPEPLWTGTAGEPDQNRSKIMKNQSKIMNNHSKNVQKFFKKLFRLLDPRSKISQKS